MAICYYSNFCEPSKKLLQLLAKTKLNQEIHFICIDKRFKSPQGDIIVEVGAQQVKLPAIVNKVPALYLIGNNKALFEDDIYRYLAPKEEAITHKETAGNMEPECYQMSSMSDAFSFWDQNADELSTKGSGGLRQIHNFVSVDQNFAITTPEENYKADKIGNNGSKSLEEYKAERDLAVVQPIKRI
jgi:hypothetical protein